MLPTVSSRFGHIVVQLNTYCNCHCRYCYLSTIDSWKPLREGILEAIATSINTQGKIVQLIWHAGEPLAAGKYLKQAIQQLNSLCPGLIRHNIQTNGTLINTSWCEFFKENDISIGISIDGPEWANIYRVDKKGNTIFAKIIRGVELLKKHGIPFHTISVVGTHNVDEPEEIYDFLIQLGSQEVCFNFVEKEGQGEFAGFVDNDCVSTFWEKLFARWESTREVKIREFDRIFDFFSRTLNNSSHEFNYDPFPTIDVDGNVYLLSPELATMEAAEYEDFVAGNILVEGLGSIVQQALNLGYIRDYLKSVEKCDEVCPFFASCRGGHISNKYQEQVNQGLAATTQTAACHNVTIRPFEVVIEYIQQKTDVHAKINSYPDLVSFIVINSCEIRELMGVVQPTSVNNIFRNHPDFSDWGKGLPERKPRTRFSDHADSRPLEDQEWFSNSWGNKGEGQEIFRDHWGDFGNSTSPVGEDKEK